MTAPTPLYLCVDVILYNPMDSCFLTIRRKNDPYKGLLAWPGGYVDPGENAYSAAIRETAEEARMKLPPGTLRLLGQYSRPDRDPRGRVVSLAFFAISSKWPKARAGDDAASVQWTSAWTINSQDMAFDHFDMMKDFERRLL